MNAEKRRLIYTWFVEYVKQSDLAPDDPFAMTYDKAITLLRDVDRQTIIDDIRSMRLEQRPE